MIHKVVYRAQWPAASVIPVWFVCSTIIAGGGLPFGAFVVAALPIGLLLAVPPAVGRFVGRMRTAADVTTSYAVCALGVWAGCLAFGITLAAGPDPADGSRRGEPWIQAFVAGMWLAQTTTGLLARWSARRRTTGSDRAAR